MIMLSKDFITDFECSISGERLFINEKYVSYIEHETKSDGRTIHKFHMTDHNILFAVVRRKKEPIDWSKEPQPHV